MNSALLHANTAHLGFLKDHRAIKTSTFALVFMGTSHQGSDSANMGMRLVGVASIFVHINDKLSNFLPRDSEMPQSVLGHYGGISSEIMIEFAYQFYLHINACGKSISLGSTTFCYGPRRS